MASTDMEASLTRGIFDFSARSILIEPVHDGDRDVLLLFAPGANTSAEAYVPLLQVTQQLCQLRLWIAIINPPLNIIFPNIIADSFDGTLDRLKDKGFRTGRFPSDNIFVAGHSLGAVSATATARRRAQGFIQIGSTFADPGFLSQFPTPVLVIAGDRDGQLTLGALAFSAGEVLADEDKNGRFNTYGRKPVVAVPGMNHAQASHGIPDKERGDLDAEIPIDVARSIVGEVVSAFLEVQFDHSNNSSSLRKLEARVKSTHEMCRAYWKAINSQGKDAEKYQLEFASSNVSTDQVVVVEHGFEQNFVDSKPWIERNGKVFAHSHLKLVSTGFVEVVKNLCIKMNSREAFGDSKSKGNVSAAAFNQRTFDEALALVSKAARNKYLESGRKLRFDLDDLMLENNQAWIESDIAYKVENEVTQVQSPVLITSVDDPSGFTAMHCMKILTVAGAMRWILQDSYRDV